MYEHEKEILLEYLRNEQPFEFQGTQRYSTLVAGLKDCRSNTKRNTETGAYNPDPSVRGHIGNWLATIGYFTILDQIGSCFKKTTTTNNQNKNNVKFAIKEFGYDLIDNDEKKLDALIALRNSFTHDFNLLNIPEIRNNNSINENQIHKFTVTAEISNEPSEKWIVKLPQRIWDMNIEGKNFNNTDDITYINLFEFGELVEKIYSRICEFTLLNQIDTKISVTKLINKYTFVRSYNPIIF